MSSRDIAARSPAVASPIRSSVFGGNPCCIPPLGRLQASANMISRSHWSETQRFLRLWTALEENVLRLRERERQDPFWFLGLQTSRPPQIKGANRELSLADARM